MTYDATRSRLTEYFDRTAADTWAKLTSDAPVSRVRATVRAGRDRMRALLLAQLPADLTGVRLLDAGCGTGALAIEAAQRGAEVTAVDVAENLVRIAQERAAPGLAIDWRVGDMLGDHGRFDAAIAMDSLIHYAPRDIAEAVASLRDRAGAVHFTVAPRTPLLSAMHLAGKAFPRSDRSPAIVPIGAVRLGREGAARGLELRRIERVTSGFYISEAWTA